MAESTLTVDYDQLRQEIGRLLNWGLDDAGDWTADEKTMGDDIINAACRKVYYPPPLRPGKPAHKWSFMQPQTTLTVVAAYSTGTITIASGVVTLADGTWPAWAASGEVTISGNTYTVDTRTDGTTITLDDTSVDETTASSYVLGRSTYDLPDDFGGIASRFVYRQGDTGYADAGIIGINHEQIMLMRQWVVYDTNPQYYGIRPATLDPTTGQRWEIIFYPTPDSAYILTYRYKVLPGKLTTTNKYPYGGMPLSECILEACLAEAERRFNDTNIHEGRFMQCLAAAIDHDKAANAPETVGKFRDGMGEVFDDGSEAIGTPGYIVTFTNPS